MTDKPAPPKVRPDLRPAGPRPETIGARLSPQEIEDLKKVTEHE